MPLRTLQKKTQSVQIETRPVIIGSGQNTQLDFSSNRIKKISDVAVSLFMATRLSYFLIKLFQNDAFESGPVLVHSRAKIRDILSERGAILKIPVPIRVRSSRLRSSSYCGSRSISICTDWATEDSGPPITFVNSYVFLSYECERTFLIITWLSQLRHC